MKIHGCLVLKPSSSDSLEIQSPNESHWAQFGHNNFGLVIGSDTKWEIFANNDRSNSIEFLTQSSHPYFRPVDDNHGYCGSDTKAWKHVYAHTVHDISPFPRKMVLDDLLKIKSDNKGKLIHNTLPEDLRTFNEERMEWEETRDMGANISYNTKGIQELYNIIQTQSDLIESLRTILEVLEK